MKVLAISGSPRRKGNTALALEIIGESIKREGIEFEIIHVGHKAIRGCIACMKCAEMMTKQCIFDDTVNEVLPKMQASDGLIFGSPVYFGGIAGTMKSFLDRAFYVSAINGNLFRGKVVATVTAVRRSGGSHTMDGLNHYASYGEMITANSVYWPIVHGRTEGEMTADEEAVQTMRVLGQQMSWIMKMKEKAQIEQPPIENKIFTNFIR